MSNLILKVQSRKLLGRKVKKLRREGILPANVYGKKVKSRSVSVELSDFEKIFKQAGETSIVDLSLDKEKLPVLIHNIQVDPVSDRPVHIDFLQVNLKEKVTSQIPVELVGESPAEKQGLGTVVQYISEIEVEALPADLLDKFEIDLSKLGKVDDTVLVRDIKVDKKKISIKKEDEEKMVVKIEELRKEEEEVVPETTELEEAEVAEKGVKKDEEKDEEKKEQTDKPQEEKGKDKEGKK
ncbi:50S ribosomal protein L25 [Patescibacteria group bacterium]|nr:50S ribosomal protein L25 [Patescibacteria group bacterium]